MEEKTTGMRLLKKGQSGLRNLLMGPMTVVLILLIGQLLVLVALFMWFDDYCVHYFGSAAVLTVFMVLHLQNKTMEPEIRTTWLIIIMSAPVFGTLMYLFTRAEIGQKVLRSRIRTVIDESKDKTVPDRKAQAALEEENPGAAALCGFAGKFADATLFANTDVTYYPVGEAKLEAMLPELEKAEKFIYLEYFIVSEGEMWGRVLEILARKAKEGVDVRMLYDGTSELMLLPKGYPKKLEALGIKCKVFAPFSPFVTTYYNYRDHRKILVIDGKVAFNGGINLSDEYINVSCKFGHWKDTAVMLKGEAVQGFTRMFLQMWNVDEKKCDFSALEIPSEPGNENGYVMPFGDIPLDGVNAGQTVYMDLLSRARNEIMIMTPYLIIDAQMEYALCYAAARGVKVRMLLPGIPDKYIPYALAKTHYKSLVEAGVEIYEYTPGFVHAKVVVIDGREAVVGTINFDWRSFCHHFECGTYMHGCSCIDDIRSDFEDCISVSRKVTKETMKKEKWHIRLVGYLMKPFSPLL